MIPGFRTVHSLGSHFTGVDFEKWLRFGTQTIRKEKSC